MRDSKGRIISLIGLLFFYQAVAPAAQIINDGSPKSSETLLKEFYNKKDVTILITDSGLGGISVLAGLERGLKPAKIFSNVNLIFVNALPSAQFSYNSLTTREEKASMFDYVLSRIIEQYKPDIILIACNTLSVVYPSTEYYKNELIPVIGIVESGVDLFIQKMKSSNDKIIILGTGTTISSNVHKQKLAERGIEPGKIITLACPDLESEIQSNPGSGMVADMIDYYTDEIKDEAADNSGRIFAGLCCSHYAYSKDIFKSVLSSKFGKDVEILNPNEPMIDSIIKKEYMNRAERTSIRASVISQAELTPEERSGIINVIRGESESAADALQNYSLVKNLFKMEQFRKKR